MTAENNQKAELMRCTDVRLAYRMGNSPFKKSSKDVLNGVSFSVYKGETLGLIGRNGTGKSTLLKLLAGIISPDSGSINNNDIRVVLLALQAGFDGNLSGRDNVVLSLMLLGMGRDETDQYMAAIEDFSGLEGMFERPVKYYSTGMKARLGFSIAYQISADIILIDEILGVGDKAFRQKSSQAIKDKMKLDCSSTFILASHNLLLVKDLCSRVIWLDEGQVHMVGEAKQVIEQYQKAI